MLSFLLSFAGGALIGLSAALLLVLNGRIAGISGIVGGLFGAVDGRLMANAAFVIGLLLGPVLFLRMFGSLPVVRIETSLPLLGMAGLLVGFGSRLGSGCTSGHGVLGLARLSPRSLAAVAVLVSAAMATVYLMRVGGAA
jgi:uncharacterized protein